MSSALIIVTKYGKAKCGKMDKIKTRTVLEAGRTDEKFADIINEINIRSTLAVLYYTDEVIGFETRLFGDEIIIKLDTGASINVDFNTFCSDKWKEFLLNNHKISKCVKKYDEQWHSNKMREINVRFAIACFILAISLILTVVFLFGTSGMIWSVSYLSIIAVGYIKAITDRKSDRHLAEELWDRAKSVSRCLEDRK